MRALEVVEATGRSLTDWQATACRPRSPASAAVDFLEPERAELYRRIDARFEAMVAAGALDEVARARRASASTRRCRP